MLTAEIGAKTDFFKIISGGKTTSRSQNYIRQESELSNFSSVRSQNYIFQESELSDILRFACGKLG